MIESTEPMSLPRREMQQIYFGTPAAPGVVVGRLYSPSSDVDPEAVPDRAAADADLDISDFQDALSAVRAELRGGSGRAGEAVPADLMALYQVYEMILGDPNLVDTVIARIRSGQRAPGAVRDTTRELTARFEGVDDAYRPAIDYQNYPR